MKRIEAFVAPHRLSRVIHALHELPRFPGLTMLDAEGQSHGRGSGGHYAYEEACLRKDSRKVLIVICEDDEAEGIARVIANAAHTGKAGDGMVVISEVSAVYYIAATNPANAGDV